MSHTYSRTASLLDEFASSFEAADEVILHKIYSSARENKKDFEEIVSGEYSTSINAVLCVFIDSNVTLIVF